MATEVLVNDGGAPSRILTFRQQVEAISLQEVNGHTSDVDGRSGPI